MSVGGKQIWWISKHMAKANSRQISSYVVYMVCLRLKSCSSKSSSELHTGPLYQTKVSSV